MAQASGKPAMFQIAVKAFVRDISLTLPQLADFQLCAVHETAVQPVEMHNTGNLPLRFQWTVGLGPSQPTPV